MTRGLGWALCVALLAGCGGGDEPASEAAAAPDSGMPEAMMPDSPKAPAPVDSTAQPMGEDSGSATGMAVALNAVGGSQATGSATISGDPNGGPDATIEVTIRNGPGSDELPVHLHRGRCGSDQGVAAPLSQLNTTEGGGQSATTTLPVATLGAGDLFIQVHDNRGNPILCGDIPSGS